MPDETKDYRKLMVVTDFPPTPVSGGSLMRQMLRNYPRDRLHWWTTASQPIGKEDQDVCPVVQFPLPPRLRPQQRVTRFKSWIVENFWVPRAVRHLRETVQQIQPERIWVHLSEWAIPIFQASALVQTHRCHVSLWDYQDGPSYRSRYGALRANHFARTCETLIRQAATWAVISDAMRADVAGRTGRTDALVFHSGIEPADLSQLKQALADSGEEIRIAYAGSIIVPEVFALFVRALSIIRKDCARPLRLHLFSRAFDQEPWFEPEWMRSHGYLTEKELFAELRGCTWGFVPMALNGLDSDYNWSSFPNKFGTYLAAGLPLIVLAHKNTSAARMFQRFPAGVHVATDNLASLVTKLHDALSDANPKLYYRAEVIRCAETEFNMDRMRCELWTLLGSK